MNNLDKINKKGFIPSSIKNSKFNYHHSRDAALIMCSLVNLIKMDKVKFNLSIHVFLNYLHFVKTITSLSKNIPNIIFNENGTPLQVSTSKTADYYILALRTIAVCQIIELFESKNYIHLIDEINIVHNVLDKHIEWIRQIYKQPCYDLWGSKYGIHYYNMKLYEMALKLSQNITNKFLISKRNDIDIVISDIQTILGKFNHSIYSQGDYYDVIIPSLDMKEKRSIARYDIYPSVLIPYMSMFGHSNELLRDKRLVNTAMIIIANNNDEHDRVFFTSDNNYSLPYIKKYAAFFRSDDNYSVLCTLAVYNVIINMNSDIKNDTLLHDWSNNTFSALKRKVVDRASTIFEGLTRHMSDTIDIAGKNTIGNDHENMIRMVSCCSLNDILSREDNLIKNNHIFGSLSRLNRLVIKAKNSDVLNRGCQTISISVGGRTNSAPKELNKLGDKNRDNEEEDNKDKNNGEFCTCDQEMDYAQKQVNDNDSIKRDEKYSIVHTIVDDLVSDVIHKVTEDLDVTTFKQKQLEDIKYLTNGEEYFDENKEEYEKESYDSEEQVEDTIPKLTPPKEVNIKTLIQLAEDFHCFKCKKNKKITLHEDLQGVDIGRIVKIHEPLVELTSLRGLDSIKDVLLDNIIYFIMNKKKKELLHVCIMGPPGVGKTVLANIIAKIYKALGILSKGHIVKKTRPDLIGKYLGHTASKTRDAIDEAAGGILFIDEAYSLVDRQGRDSFAKECIDTLTQHLTDKCEDMLCIIAGYKKDIEEYFFASNKGLDRRFAFKFNIESYKHDELFNIFVDKMEAEGWKIDSKTRRKGLELFKEKHDKFKNFGGDVENLVYRYGLVYNRENFFNSKRTMDINIKTLVTSIDHLFSGETKEDESWRSLYC
jgi:SpoVK/Ycf46/Vps4 family AAA+-type ATPase